MKTSAILVGAAATFVAAQFPSGFPACGVTCITNMLGLANSFGCTPDNAKCLCSNVNFVYGVRDCADQACPGGSSGTDASTVKSFGVNYCYSAGVAVSGIPASIVATGASITTTIFATNSPGPATSGLASNTVSGAVSSVVSSLGSAASSAASAASSAISTIPIVSTIVSGGSTITSTIGMSTIFGIGGAVGSAISTVPVVTTISSGGSVITSTIGSSTIFASGSATTLVSNSQTVITSGGSTFTTSVPVTQTSTVATTSSKAFAAQRTAAPVGFIAAAGLAAMLL